MLNLLRLPREPKLHARIPEPWLEPLLCSVLRYAHISCVPRAAGRRTSGDYDQVVHRQMLAVRQVALRINFGRNRLTDILQTPLHLERVCSQRPVTPSLGTKG